MKKIVFISSYSPLSRFKRRLNYFEGEYERYLIYWKRESGSDYEIYKDWCENVIEIKLPTFASNPIKRIPDEIKFKKNVKKYLANIKPDIVLLQDLDVLISFCPYMKKRGSKVIYEVRDLHSLIIDKQKGFKKLIQNYLRRKESKSLKKTDLMIITSDAFYDKYYFDRIEKNKSIFIPNCPKFDDIHPTQKDNNEPFTIGFVGVIRYADQIKMLIDATDKCGVNVLIRGMGSDSDVIEEYCKGRDNVAFGGRFEYSKDASDIYSSVDVIYSVYNSNLTNVKLALPNRLYDAIAFKKPIIVAEGTHLADVVNGLGIGESINPNSIEELEAVINKWKEKGKEYLICVDNCEKSKSVCDYDKYKKQTLDIINSFFK